MQRPAVVAHGLKISVVSGPEVGQTTSIEANKAIVGRSQACDFRISDATASSFHVELSVEEGAIGVRDLESRNGTIYQGARLSSAVVPSGSTLEIGSSVVRVELDVLHAAPVDELASFGDLVGVSRVMRRVFALLTRLARTELSLLVEGPTGTGKELVARAIHEASAHASGPLIVLDCTAIPQTLAESVLFGHEKGAFTGATERRAGAFEAAGNGTVFIDEVGELPLELQPKLLRVLEQRQVARVGSSQPIPIGARVVSATWRDLRASVNRREFREDLYYRLAQARVTLPPLSERQEDIPLLVQHFLAMIPAGATAARSISQEALQQLSHQAFPGNVRELCHTVERAAMLAGGASIQPSDLAFERILVGERARAAHIPLDVGDDEPLPPFKEAKRSLVDGFEHDYLEQLMQRVGRNLSRAAQVAGVERHHLRELLRKHGLWNSEES